MSAFGRDTRMRLTARQVNAGVVIAVEGALTASTARQFLRRARGLLAFVEMPRVAIDLSGVPRLDASGGAALIGGEGGMGAEEAVEGALGGGAGEDGGEGRKQPTAEGGSDRRPGNLPDPRPRRVARKVDSAHAVP